MSVTESVSFSVKTRSPHLPHRHPMVIVVWVGWAYTEAIIIMLGEDQLLRKV